MTAGHVAVQVAAGLGFAAIAAGIAWRLGLGLAWPIVRAALRAVVQLAAVGAAIALVFRVPALSFAFAGAMILAAALTSGGRIGAVPRASRIAAVSIAGPALTATGLLLLVGAFEATPRAAVPTVGILVGGAMTATTICGRRLLEGLRDDFDAVEARLALGDDVRGALRPTVRTAITAGLVPVVDQTRSVGLVTLPGTFVGLVLGGASAVEAAGTQLVVLLALLAVELASAAIVAALVVREVTAPGERVVPPAGWEP